MGIDISKSMLRLAKEHTHNRQNAFLIQADAEYLPLRSSVFTKVVCLYTLPYIPNWQRFLNEVFRVLWTGGLFISTFSNASSVRAFTTMALIEFSDLVLGLFRRLNVGETIARFLFALARMLDIFPYRDDKGWAISFLRYGIPPFRAYPYSLVLAALRVAKLRIVDIFGSKRGSSLSILATKD